MLYLKLGNEFMPRGEPRSLGWPPKACGSKEPAPGVAIENKGDILIASCREGGKGYCSLLITVDRAPRICSHQRKLSRFSSPTQLVFTAVLRLVIAVPALCRTLIVFHLRIAWRLLNNAAAILACHSLTWDDRSLSTCLCIHLCSINAGSLVREGPFETVTLNESWMVFVTEYYHECSHMLFAIVKCELIVSLIRH